MVCFLPPIGLYQRIAYQPVYLHANGVTFIAEDFAPNGLVKSNVGNGDEWFYIAEDREDLKSKTDFWDDANSPTEQSIDGQLISADRIVTTRVTNMESLFKDTVFNQPIGTWDTSSVTNMYSMFMSSIFNHPIGMWDTSSVTYNPLMFLDSVFDQPIGMWDMSNAINMTAMFQSSVFNQPIGTWDTSSVNDMHSMFFNNPYFNQDLSTWCVTLRPTKPEYFDQGATAWTLPKPVWGTCP